MESCIVKNEAFDVVSSLNYEKGKPAFRSLMRNHHGETVLVALSKDSELGEHVAPEDVIITVLEGEVEFRIFEYDVQRMSAGQAIVMEKGTKHSVKPLRDSKLMLVKIRP